MFQILIYVLAFSPFALCAFPRYYPIPRPESAQRTRSRRCGTAHPPDRLSDTLRTLQTIEPLENNTLWSPTTFFRQVLSQPLHKRQSVPLITIPIHFHLVTDQPAASPTNPLYTRDEQVRAQFKYIQDAFAPLSVEFSLESITRTINSEWAAARDELGMKTALRKGTYRHLNIYVQSDLKSDGTDGLEIDAPLLGVCSLPVTGITPTTSPGAYVYDGCSILSSTITDGAFRGYNLGGTTVHEIGHWFGLLHTFEGETCDVSSWGDYVADTPQQMIATQGCPDFGAQDSCPVSGVLQGWTGQVGEGPNPYTRQGYSGTDNTRNWMDYSSDECYESFSAGQGARVVNAFNLWRKGR